MINLIYSYFNFYYRIIYNLKYNLSIGSDTVVQFWKIRFNNLKDVYLEVGEGSYVASDINFEKDNSKLIIGKNSFVSGAKFSISSKVQIKDNVSIAFGTVFFDHNSHSLNYKFRRQDLPNRLKSFKDWSDVKSDNIIIEDDVWIGANSIILKGLTLGKGSIIAAGSVVTKSTKPFHVYGGNPAKIIKKIDVIN
jgi:galactoside O-acetyltransferase